MINFKTIYAIDITPIWYVYNFDILNELIINRCNVYQSNVLCYLSIQNTPPPRLETNENKIH